MIQLNFLNAVVEDNGNGLRVNGKDLNSIISAALGTIKKIPGRYEYLGEENKNKPFESQLCSPIFFCLNFRRFLVITQIISNGFT